MAIQRTIWKENGNNVAAIGKATDLDTAFIGRHRVRMSRDNKARYGPYTAGFITNDSAQDCLVMLGYTGRESNAEAQIFFLNANSNLSISNEDGIKFYDMDIENLDAATDVPIAKIRYAISVVRQIKE